MNGNAPKSPLTGSHAVRVKKCQPNCASERRDPVMSVTRMKMTMRKIEQAHNSRTALKLWSASVLGPQLFRKILMGDGEATAGCGALDRDGSATLGRATAVCSEDTGLGTGGSRSLFIRGRHNLYRVAEPVAETA